MTDTTLADLDRLLVGAQNPTRRAILVALLEDRAARTVDEVAALAGVHRTVAFGHLERLADTGLVTKELRRGRQGKPAALYRAAGPALTAAIPQRQFAQLAQLLAETLGTLRDRGRTLAHRTGVRHGELVGGARAAGMADALAPLQQLGGGFEADDEHHVTSHNCVYLEACQSGSDVVCWLQAGLIEGALTAGGAAVAVRPAGPTAAGGCRYVVSTA